MELVDRKNQWRRQEALKVREHRVTTGYMEAKYPQIYEEAIGFFNMLNNTYPDKKDLRKTNEYLWMRKGISGEKIRKYYTRKTQSKIDKKVSSKTDRVDNMQLIIPLMKTPTQTQDNGVEYTPDNNVIDLSTDNVVEISTDNNVVEISTDNNVVEISTDNNAIDLSTDNVVEISTDNNAIEPSWQDDIPDDMFQEIIDGLRADLDLHTIFDDLDIEIEDPTPLERELMNM